tara:strand:+ start:336 stop:1142 length:807 start_codon:yes stop_codon:yes gene_type:complete
MTKLFFGFILLLGLTFITCKESPSQLNSQKEIDNSNISLKTQFVDSSIVYQSENLLIKKLSNHVYKHISYLNTDDYGKVACNGMLVINNNESIIFDTPTDKNSSLELMNFLTHKLKSKIIAVIPTHFHEDCIGGIQVFEEQNILVYATTQTITLLKENGQKISNPIQEFNKTLTLDIGNKKVYAEYFGQGHTKDNIIGYYPEEHAVFGGCLIKNVGSSKGFLGDANTSEWSNTVQKIKLKYPEAKIVIPGHGKAGGTELLDYTIKLFE